MSEVKHPAKFHDKAILYANKILKDCSMVLDPFAGIGRVHELRNATRTTYGVEIEQEWAECHPDTFHADSTQLASMFDRGFFDGVFTSPTYGNRMADHFEARDSSHRITYRHYLGRELDENNSGRMQWGDRYRFLHQDVYLQLSYVVRKGGIGVFNLKNHIRKGEEIPVVEWHVDALTNAGWRLRRAFPINTPGMKQGENYAARVDADLLVVMEKVE